MATAPDPAINDKLQILPDSIADGGYAINRGGSRVELPATVVAHHNGGSSHLHCPLMT